MLAIAALIRLDSPGPVLFRHRRPARLVRVRGRDLEGRTDLHPPPGGYDRDRITTCRLISRWSNFAPCTETRQRAYAREDFRSQDPHVENDPRITRVGRMLRKLSVDEL